MVLGFWDFSPTRNIQAVDIVDYQAAADSSRTDWALIVRFSLFFLTWFVVLSLAFFYVGRRLIRSSGLQKRAKTLLWIGMGLWLLLPNIPFMGGILRSQSVVLDTLAWPGYVSLGIFSVVLVLVLLRDLVVLFGRFFAKIVARPGLSGNPGQVQPVDPGRREFLMRTSSLAIVGGAGILGGYGLYEARRRATIEEVTVPLAGLPSEFEGYRIAQFTDLHVGPTIKRPFVEQVVRQVVELAADCVVFTGDLVDGTVPWLRDELAPFREISAPDGCYFVTGNHEYYSGALPWVEEAERLGFTVLMNEHRVIEKSSGRLVLAGVADYGASDFVPAHASNVEKAVQGSPEGAVKILLAHQPRSVHAAASAGIHLQLSGHTHGGQLFPWDNLARLAQPYIRGLHRHGDTWVYVNRGTGYWGPPIRIGIPPEITLVRLVRA